MAAHHHCDPLQCQPEALALARGPTSGPDRQKPRPKQLNVTSHYGGGIARGSGTTTVPRPSSPWAPRPPEPTRRRWRGAEQRSQAPLEAPALLSEQPASPRVPRPCAPGAAGARQMPVGLALQGAGAVPVAACGLTARLRSVPLKARPSLSLDLTPPPPQLGCRGGSAGAGRTLPASGPDGGSQS